MPIPAHRSVGRFDFRQCFRRLINGLNDQCQSFGFEIHVRCLKMRQAFADLGRELTEAIHFAIQTPAGLPAPSQCCCNGCSQCSGSPQLAQALSHRAHGIIDVAGFLADLTGFGITAPNHPQIRHGAEWESA